MVGQLEALVGEWSIEAVFEGAPPSDLRGRAHFSWMPGGPFLLLRWEVPIPEAPDGLAVMGYDEGRSTLLQHYFDTRGVARVYEMGFDGGVWTLSRTEPDFSPLSFSQRFRAELSEDGKTLSGTWERTEEGAWIHDFDLIYRRVAPPA